MELTINGEVYKFKFGIKFLKTINDTQKLKAPDGSLQPAGFAYKAAGLMDGNILDLIDVLTIANHTEDKRITSEVLETYLDDENTNVDLIFQDTINFLSQSNACKTRMKSLMKNLEQAFDTQEEMNKTIMFRPR